VDAFDELAAVVARLRRECPWDRAQTAESLRPYVLEEAYEVVSAIDAGEAAALRKELGDVLFQVLLLARIAEDGGLFSLEDVIRGATEKMVRRHPHVFDPAHVATEEDVGIQAWERRKVGEHRGSVLDGVPDALPSLLRAHRVSEKAGRVGFDWPDLPSVRAKVDEELAELDEAIARGAPSEIGEELGDLLFALVNLGRRLPVSAEDALRMATTKFERRFREVELRVSEIGRTVFDVDLEELERHWTAVKRAEKR
jgi:MazG family protein